MESLASTLVDSQVDLNPHQVDAALFACRNPLSRGVLLADEVGLGKTIEAGLVISQRWAERRRKILIIVPANLRKQWHQELQDKFGLQGLILEAKATTRSASRIDRIRSSLPLARSSVPTSSPSPRQTMSRTLTGTWSSSTKHIACATSTKPATSLPGPQGGVVARSPKVLLTATPLQNSLLELYGLVSFIDDRVFGDLDSFRSQFTGREQAFNGLRDRLAPICKRTLRKEVQPYVSYTARKAIIQEFTPSSEEQELSRLVADYLRRPNQRPCPRGSAN